MIYFVTGASGFIGKECCKKIISEGHKVITLIRREDPYLNSIGVECHIGDLWELNNYKHILRDVNIVIHCAGNASFGNGPNYNKINTELTKYLVSIIKISCPSLNKLTFISSIGVYDRKWGDFCYKVLREDSKCFPSSDYGKSKLKAETIIRKSNLPYTIIRPSLVVGKNMRYNSHFSVFLRHALKRSLFGIINWPGIFSVIHINDLVQAVLLISNHEKTNSEIYNCSGLKISLGDVFIHFIPNNLYLNIKWIVKVFYPIIAFFPFKIKALLLPALVSSDKKLQNLSWEPQHSSIQQFKDVFLREEFRLNHKKDTQLFTVVTGAASGLGFAFFTYLLKFRKNLILIDKNIDKLNEIKNQYPGVEIIHSDLTEKKDMLDLYNKIFSTKHIGELYLCAGIGKKGFLHHSDFNSQQKIIELNFISRIRLAMHSYPLMEQKQFGRIIIVSSSSAFQPLPLMATYAASNAALLSLGRAWSQEIKDKGIHILTICPSGMNTNFQKNANVKMIKGERLLNPKKVVQITMRGIDKNQKTIYISFRAKLMSLIANLIPTNLYDSFWFYMMKRLR